jgi:myosin protein heavy chain/myosin heavy chain 6/7
MGQDGSSKTGGAWLKYALLLVIVILAISAAGKFLSQSQVVKHRVEKHRARIALKKQIAEQRKNASQLSQELDLLRQQRTEFESRLQTMQAELDGNREEIDRLTADLENARQATAEEKPQVVLPKDKAVEKLKKDIQDLKGRLKVAETERDRLKKTAGPAQKLQLLADSLERKLKETETELQQREKELRTAQAEVKRLSRGLADTTEGSTREVQQLRAALETAENGRRQALARFETNEKQFVQMKKELAAANERIADLIVAVDLSEQLARQARGGK